MAQVQRTQHSSCLAQLLRTETAQLLRMEAQQHSYMGWGIYDTAS